MNIGEFIRFKRKEKKLTLKDLASEIGLSHTYLSQIELGDRNVSPDILERIAKVLDISYLELMEIAGFWQKKDLESHLKDIRNKYDYENLLFSLAIKASEFVEIGENLNFEDDKLIINEEELSIFISNYLDIRNIAQKWLKDFWEIDNSERYLMENYDIKSIDYNSYEPNEIQLEEVLLKENIKYKENLLSDNDKEKILKILDTIL